MAAKGRRPKAPFGCFWKDGILHGQVKIKGKRRRWSLRTTDPKVASERREAEKDQQVARAYYGSDTTGVLEVFELLCAHMEKEGASADTIQRYTVSMTSEKALGPYLLKKTVFDINRTFLNRYVEERQKVVTNATIRRDLTALSATIEHAIWKGIGGDQLTNVVQLVMRGLEEKRDPIFLPHDEDIALVLSLAPGSWPWLIKATLNTGAREDELVSADERSFSEANKTFTVNAGKGNKMRVISLKWRGGVELFKAIPRCEGKPWLFWRHTDKRQRSDSKRPMAYRGDKIDDPAQEFRRIVLQAEKVARERGVQFVPFTFHDLRHRHCVDYLRSGGNIFDLNRRCGHATLEQTNQYLDCLTPEEARIAKYGRGVEGDDVVVMPVERQRPRLVS